MSIIKLCTIFHNFWYLTYKCSGLLSHYISFVMFLHYRVIHTSSVVPTCNEHYLVNQEQPPWTKIIYTCLMYPVLGQWLKFSKCPCLSSGLFSHFCTYTIFWPVKRNYRNTNLHMHLVPTKNIFMKLYCWYYSTHLIYVYN